MRKGEGKAQQIRGHKRREKVLTMRKNRSNRSENNHQPGQIYWNALVNDEAKRLQRENGQNQKMQAQQVTTVKPQMHRRKSGSA